MQIEDFLNQTISTKRLTSYQRLPGEVSFSLTPEEKTGPAAQGQESASEGETQGGYFTLMEQQASEAQIAFKHYMDKATGRVPQAPKTPEEKIKELTEKIKKLQTQLSEIMANQSLSESVQQNQAENITSQINALHAEIAEVGKEVAQEAQSEA